ncbi:hypothetical protein TNCV_1089241 [Trichonephila clavipes]|uniref:Uncharacterized protein n=1 Tax=Trichonephila clavipes TaxID=2585209 RepID=A0A8X6T2E7_TRICX|nr:hypothetical protein TNCV_1089241 [Trichonephila clavipes]
MDSFQDTDRFRCRNALLVSLSEHQTSLEDVHSHPKSNDSWPSNESIVLPPMAHSSGWSRDACGSSQPFRTLFVNTLVTSTVVSA